MRILAILFLFLGTFGHTTEIRRVVSLSPALTELIFQLGCGELLVGRSDACDFPAEVSAVPIAGRFASPQVETIVSLRPDLLISNALINPGISKTFIQRGIEVLILPGATLADYRQSVQRLGSLLGAAKAAATELQRIDNFLQHLPPPLALKILWVIWDSPLMVGGGPSLPDEIIRLCGAENLAGTIPQAYCKCSFEWLWENQPDVIIWSAPERDLKNDRLWRRLRAVQSDRVITDLPEELLLRPGPRLLDGVRDLRSRLQKISLASPTAVGAK